MISSGYAGSGSPACSRRTNRNTNVTPTCSSHPMTVAMLIAPPREPETEYAAIGPARSRARALASARQPLPRHLDEGLVRQRWRGAGGALRVAAGRRGPAHQTGVEMLAQSGGMPP